MPQTDRAEDETFKGCSTLGTVALNPRLCRVCGFEAEDEPWGPDGTIPTFDYCPCCGVEWGYQDSSEAGIAMYRAKWIGQGARWSDSKVEGDGMTTEARLARLS